MHILYYTGCYSQLLSMDSVLKRSQILTQYKIAALSYCYLNFIRSYNACKTFFYIFFVFLSFPFCFCFLPVFILFLKVAVWVWHSHSTNGINNLLPLGLLSQKWIHVVLSI